MPEGVELDHRWPALALRLPPASPVPSPADTVSGLLAPPSQRDALPHDIVVEGHGLIETAGPVLLAEDDGTEHRVGLQFEVEEPTGNGVFALGIDVAVDEDQDIPIGIGRGFPTCM